MWHVDAVINNHLAACGLLVAGLGGSLKRAQIVVRCAQGEAKSTLAAAVHRLRVARPCMCVAHTCARYFPLGRGSSLRVWLVDFVFVFVCFFFKIHEVWIIPKKITALPVNGQCFCLLSEHGSRMKSYQYALKRHGFARRGSGADFHCSRPL